MFAIIYCRRLEGFIKHISRFSKQEALTPPCKKTPFQAEKRFL